MLSQTAEGADMLFGMISFASSSGAVELEGNAEGVELVHRTSFLLKYLTSIGIPAAIFSLVHSLNL